MWVGVHWWEMGGGCQKACLPNSSCLSDIMDTLPINTNKGVKLSGSRHSCLRPPWAPVPSPTDRWWKKRSLRSESLPSHQLASKWFCLLSWGLRATHSLHSTTTEKDPKMSACFSAYSQPILFSLVGSVALTWVEFAIHDHSCFLLLTHTPSAPWTACERKNMAACGTVWHSSVLCWAARFALVEAVLWLCAVSASTAWHSWWWKVVLYYTCLAHGQVS